MENDYLPKQQSDIKAVAAINKVIWIVAILLIVVAYI